MQKNYGTDHSIEEPEQTGGQTNRSILMRYFSESEFTISDSFPKTEFFFTTVNVVKSFLGLGILAAPYGFKLCGMLIGSLILIINGTLNYYTVKLQAKAAVNFGKKVKTYTDLGFRTYGEKGRMMVAVAIVTN